MNAGVWRSFQAIPDDVLFFRDGKPASLGADHYLRSLFPPHPSTLYGAVRTRRLLDARVPLSALGRETWAELVGPLAAEVGAWGRFGSLRLRGPWLVRAGEVLLPAPADLELIVQPSKTATGRDAQPGPPIVEKVLQLRPSDGGEAGWSHPLRLLEAHERTHDGWALWQSPPRAEPTSSAGWLVRPAGLGRWMAGGLPEPEDLVHGSQLWLDEVRTGLGLQPTTRAAEEGQLYTFGFIRLRPGVGIGFEVAGSGLEPGGTVRLGGEGRTARLEEGPGLPLLAPPEPRPDGRFRLYLATPALSEAGGYPPGFPTETLTGQPAGVSCRLLAAAVRRFSLVGGWDMAVGRAKSLRRAIPAGSVYWLQATEPVQPPVGLHGAHLSDFPGEELGRQGYGLALLGAEA